MKAVLILDKMPRKCADCPALRGADEYCNASGIVPTLIEDIFTRPDCCPLKELPSKMRTDGKGVIRAFVEGYNFCLDAIEGTED